ncbi:MULTISPECIES: hypothetical protein [unclassified Mycolicibacterium]|uniref:hypothetical protein n=2 Tax=Mycolicibacterium TaxID=1866885 RepID=UPI00192E73C1|nr:MULTISPECIES: hypothetical protein [unclassified Mycolicibacterium]
MSTETETLDPPIDLVNDGRADDPPCHDGAETDCEGREDDAPAGAAEPATTGSTTERRWLRITAYWVIPAIVMLLGAAAGYFTFQNHSATAADQARTAAVKAATESTIALLSYQPDTADKALNEVRDRLTGTFRDAYTSLIHDVVIPGAKQKHISSVATVPAAASVSASAQHAVVLVFVNQSVIVGTDAPTGSTSCVKVGLDKVDGKWLISQFDPV